MSKAHHARPGGSCRGTVRSRFGRGRSRVKGKVGGGGWRGGSG